ncbi:hypothetical protein PM082_006383 [Marasmius tenuissimus]|nr:hypothetical protein PM082_006383 [Marasmius tenuissimus]
MQFKLALVAAASSVLAAPATLEVREPAVDGSLFVCSDANFSGQCANLGFFRGQCSNMPSGFQDNISSFGPDAGWECTTYTDSNCSGLTYSGHNPGFPTLPPGINDAISSFRCEPL